jgi:hypothetical protein
MKITGYVLNGSDSAEADNVSGKLIRVSTLACRERKIFLTMIAAILTDNLLNTHDYVCPLVTDWDT